MTTRKKEHKAKVEKVRTKLSEEKEARLLEEAKRRKETEPKEAEPKEAEPTWDGKKVTSPTPSIESTSESLIESSPTPSEPNLRLPEIQTPISPPPKPKRRRKTATHSRARSTKSSKVSPDDEGAFTTQDGMLIGLVLDGALFQPALGTRPIATKGDLEKLSMGDSGSELEILGERLAAVLNKYAGDIKYKEEMGLIVALSCIMTPRVLEARRAAIKTPKKASLAPKPQPKREEPKEVNVLDIIPQDTPAPALS